MNETLPRMVLARARQKPQAVSLRHKEEGIWHDITRGEVEQQIRRFAGGLLRLGLKPGERVAVMAPNSPEWVFADLGAMSCRGISVPVYHTEGLKALQHIVADSESRFLFLHSPLVAEEFAPLLEQMPFLERIILLQGKVEHPRILPLEEFLGQPSAAEERQLEALLDQGDPEEPATIVYTSGTTGRPKGVVLSHRNFLSNVEACARLFDIGPEDECLSFLPLSHVFERMAGYYFILHQGGVIAYAENFDSVPVNLTEIRPTILISVPRLYEKMYTRVMERVLSGPWLKKQLFFTGLKVCRELVRQELAGRTPPASTRTAARFFRSVVFSKLRHPLGGRLRFFVSGGAPLGRDIAEFFMAAGIPIYEGYGLTETSPVIAANCPGAIRLGSVGRPVPGTEVRIADDGEILARGPGVFQGYWQKPQETAAVFSDDWLHTGDVGTLDADGYLAITDRKKDLIVTASGENIAPQNLENLFKRDKYLANSLVYGDRKPYLTALLVPNFDNLEKYARFKRLNFLNHCDLVNHPRVLDLVRRRIDRLQEGMPSFQRIKRFTLLSRDFTKEEMTPTLKVRRKQVAKNFHSILEGMYLPQDHGVHDAGFCIVENLSEEEKA